MKISLEECKEKMNNYGGNLDLENTNITELPNNLVVNGYLYLENTNITELPSDLVVKGSLDLRGTKITELPQGLVVKGSLYLSHTNITELPSDLVVNGYLDLSYTNITKLPKDLVVNGSLYLRGTNITKLPSGLVVNGSLDLRGTKITELPSDLVVQYSIYSDKDFNESNVKKLNDGNYVKGKYLYSDGIITLVKTKKRVLDKYDYFVGKFKDQNVIYDGKYYAHCKNIKDGIIDLEFKYAKDRGLNQYEDLNLESILSFNECKHLYRIITGACKQGTESFIDKLGEKRKDKYSIKELIDLTKNQYGNETLVKFFDK